MLTSNAARTTAAVGLVAFITYVDFGVFRVNSAAAALSYLLLVLACATWWGLLQSTAAAIAAVLCLNFFFMPPVATFTIADPQNWIALLAFLLTAITVSQLSARARQRTDEAVQRKQEMEQLYELSRSLLLTDPERPLASQLAGQIAQIFRLDAVAYFDRNEGEVAHSGPTALPLSDAQLRSIATEGTVYQDHEKRVIALPVSLGGKVLGSLALSGSAVSETAAHAIANLAAIALERERAQLIAGRAEVARQNQELKSTLLDTVAHEFKTPLTSVKAAVTTLLCDSSQTTTQREMLSVIDEETDRLSAMVTEAIEMARVEAGQVSVRKRPVPIAELIRQARERLDANLEGRDFIVDIQENLPMAAADAELVRSALRHLIANALKYSVPDSPITVRAALKDRQIIVSVADQGPGVPEKEQALIFERFYRGRAARGRIAGTGMGLPIARDIIRAHGGELWLENPPNTGATFCFSLPAAQEGSP